MSSDYPFPPFIPEGLFADFDLRLTSIPTSLVNISLASSPQLSVIPNEVSFSPASWNTTQTIRIWANHDSSIMDGPSMLSAVSVTFLTDDVHYNQTGPVSFDVPVRDVDKSKMNE